MTDKGWKFEVNGSKHIPKSLEISVLETANLESRGSFDISIVTESQSSVTLNVNVSSTKLFTEDLAPLDIGVIVNSVIPYDQMPLVWQSQWVPCDGRDVADTSKYADLRHKIVDQGRGWKGEINTKTRQVRVPDLRGEFLRGLNDLSSDHPLATVERQERGDTDGDERVAGSLESDTFKRHTHDYDDVFFSETPVVDGQISKVDVPKHLGLLGNHDYDNVGYQMRRTTIEQPANVGGSETRPRNVAVYYYIKIN